MYPSLIKLLEALGVNKREQLYAYAVTQLGNSLSGVKAPIELGCVEAFCNVVNGFAGATVFDMVHTAEIRKALDRSIRFQKLSDGEPMKRGDIIVSVTGEGKAGTRGHIGIYDGKSFMSNNSKTGKWDNHIPLGLWIGRYLIEYRMPLHRYRIVF